jgi:peptide/nickel transport system permease protein
MLDVLGEDYIRTARSKGLRQRHIVVRHGLRSP